MKLSHSLPVLSLMRALAPDTTRLLRPLGRGGRVEEEEEAPPPGGSVAVTPTARTTVMIYTKYPR